MTLFSYWTVLTRLDPTKQIELYRSIRTEARRSGLTLQNTVQVDPSWHWSVDGASDHDDLNDDDLDDVNFDDEKYDLDIDDLVTPPSHQRVKLQVKFAKDGEQEILDLLKQGKKRRSRFYPECILGVHNNYCLILFGSGTYFYKGKFMLWPIHL